MQHFGSALQRQLLERGLVGAQLVIADGQAGLAAAARQLRVGAFPDRASALRLITAVAPQVTGIWDDRRYLDMSLLSPPAAKAA